MTARKMVVVVLTKTRAVLGAVSRRASGAPTVEQVIGDFLVARTKGSEASLAVPAADLTVKEVDHRDGIFRTPMAYVLDNTDAVVVSQNRVDNAAVTNTASGVQVTLTLSTSSVPAEKDVLLIVDAGATSEPLRFAAKTVVNTAPAIPVSGVPAGSRLVLASVDGYNSLLMALTFV